MTALIRTTFVLALAAASILAQSGGELRLTLRNEPKSFDPALVDESSGETIRYLTGGVLVRLNRKTQQLEPELAQSWKIGKGGRDLYVQLRKGIVFSNGSPFTASDVAYTFQRLMDPQLRSPTGDAFRSGDGGVSVRVHSPEALTISFPTPVASVERMLDQVAIQSARSPQDHKVVLGPFVVAEYKPGDFIRLIRNNRYWKKDSSGKPLPYLGAVRFDIQPNRDIEALRFRRGEIHMIDTLDPELFDQLKGRPGIQASDAGASTDVEMLWFNQADRSPLPQFKKAWFQSREFRQAVSAAINRSDIVRLVYRGYAQAAAGPVPATSTWFNPKLKPQPHQPAEALRKLQSLGFRLDGGTLKDPSGKPVVFSLITNSGNKVRSRIASMIQQDLKKIGIAVNITTLDFASLLERIGRTFEYEACLLGLVNVDPDPNAQMNVWLSSSSNHQWNPGQKTPATKWEAEIDVLMRAQAAALNEKQRKQAFFTVQEIVAREAPFVYLVNRHSLSAVSASLREVAPTTLRPSLLWNVEYLQLNAPTGASNVRTASAR